jgi:hypothetical protein
VSEEHAAEGILGSSDAQQDLDAIAEYAEAGFDRVIVAQCGSDQDRLVARYAQEVPPEIRAPTSRPPA